MKEIELDNNLVIEKYYELNTVRAVAKYFHKRVATIRGILRDSGIDTINYSKSKINPITNEKICTKCLVPKSLDSFRLGKTGRYSAYCRSCLNKPRIKDKKVNYHKKRYGTDELYTFKTDIRKTIWSSFNRKRYKKNTKSYQILGADWGIVKEYVESQFSEGMTWDNYGEWVFDHKIPISICKTQEEVIKLNHYTNFQPLWAKDNSRKRDKILPEFEHLINEYLGDIRTRPPLLE